jgi:hypothetical protein
MNRRRQLPAAEPCADVDDLFCVLRDNLGKADAYISTAEELVERVWERGGAEADDGVSSVMRRRNHVEHLIESAKLAVRAAAYTGEQLEERARRQRGA